MSSEPRAWVGCLACYNHGHLSGQWVEGVEAGDAIPCNDPTHNEYYVFDLEGYGPTLAGECSPEEAQTVAETLTELSDEERPAFFAYVSHGGGYGPVDVRLEEFRDSFVGIVWTERDFAEELVDDHGYLRDVPDFVARYFDYDTLARDLFMDDYFSVPAPGVRLYVFRRI